jgi:hypothetical protein
MGHLLAVFGLIRGILAAAFTAQVADEIKAWIPWLTKRLVERSVSRLPASLKDRYKEEWSRHVEDTPGHLGKFFTALYLFRASVTMRSEFHRFKIGQLKRWVEIIVELQQQLVVHKGRLNVLTTQKDVLIQRGAVLDESLPNQAVRVDLEQKVPGWQQLDAEVTAMTAEVTAMTAEVNAVTDRARLLKEEINREANGGEMK